jgi:hypothetical protein
MKTLNLRLLIAAAILSAGALLQAQSAHYPAGVEGIKAASLPPPGWYLRDYNYLYLANDFPGGPPDFDLTAYVQAPRLIWISPFKVLGAYYGADVLVPFVYQDVEVGTFQEDEFGLGDVFVEPITLSWHLNRFDVSLGYGFWAPSGDSDLAHPASPGKGYWTHMLTAGATWYLDADKTWAISALNRYEINQENPDADLTPGQVWTLEGGVSKTLGKTVDVGLIGYAQLQTTSDSGVGAVSDKDQVLGLGPEVNIFVPKIGLFASARYVYEFSANNRPEGHTINVTLTKRF